MSEWNRRVGWLSIAAGIGSGLVLGMWSFDGPMDVPAWLGDYSSTGRRLVRLGHIAFVGLGVIDVLLAREMPRLVLSEARRRVAAGAMIFGNVFLPLVLVAAGPWRPVKWLLPVPAVAVFVAISVMAWGAWHTPLAAAESAGGDARS